MEKDSNSSEEQSKGGERESYDFRIPAESSSKNIVLIAIRTIRDSLDRLSTWLFFCVVIALAPILFDLLASRIANQPFNLVEDISQGNLLAISIGLLGDSMAYLWKNQNVTDLKNQNVTDLGKQFFSAACGFVFFGLVIVLAMLSTHPTSKNVNLISEISLFLFVCTLIVGGYCRWMEG